MSSGKQFCFVFFCSMFFMLANFKRNFLTLYCQLNEYLGCCYSFLSALTPLVRWQTNNTGPCVVHIVAVVMGSWFICGPHTVVHLKQDLTVFLIAVQHRGPTSPVID